MLRYLPVILFGAASGGFISFRLDRSAATRDAAPSSPPAITADAGVRADRQEDAKAPGPDPRELVAPSRDDVIGAQEELRLIEAANAAVIRGDFMSALPPLIEHERRFQQGWLTQEREVLSVRAIDGLLISESAPSRAPPRVASTGAPGAPRGGRPIDASGPAWDNAAGGVPGPGGIIGPAERSPTPDVPFAAANRW